MFVELGLRERTEESYMKKQEGESLRKWKQTWGSMSKMAPRRDWWHVVSTKWQEAIKGTKEDHPEKGQNHWRGRQRCRAQRFQGISLPKERELESWDLMGEWDPLQVDKGAGNWWHWKRQRATETCQKCDATTAKLRRQFIELRQ